MLIGDNNPEIPAQGAAQDMIFDVTAMDFEDRVLKASMEKPVIVDFWAPWCGPCKQLDPVLLKAVQAAGGEVLLAKVNLDENQELAAALRIQSVPTVYAFYQGRPVDAFQGLVPPAQIQEFIDKLVQLARQNQPDAIDIPEALSAAAQALSEKDFATAQGIYQQILMQDEKNTKAYIGIVRTFIAAGHIEQAAALVENAPGPISADPAFSEARTALEMAQAQPAGDIPALEKKVAAKPKDHQARYDLALAQFSAGRQEEAIENLLEIIQRDPKWNEDAARKQLLKFFEALGHSDPLTLAGRRKLSSLLFS